jgi:hypothetical protein
VSLAKTSCMTWAACMKLLCWKQALSAATRYAAAECLCVHVAGMEHTSGYDCIYWCKFCDGCALLHTECSLSVGIPHQNLQCVQDVDFSRKATKVTFDDDDD